MIIILISFNHTENVDSDLCKQVAIDIRHDLKFEVVSEEIADDFGYYKIKVRGGYAEALRLTEFINTYGIAPRTTITLEGSRPYTVLGRYEEEAQTYVDVIEWEDRNDMAGLVEEAHRRCNESNNPFDQESEPEDYAAYATDLTILFVVEGDIAHQIVGEPFQQGQRWAERTAEANARPLTDVELLRR